MLARRMPGILPPLTMQERIEVTKVHSASREGNGTLSRAGRSGHPTTPCIDLRAGGGNPRPGEVSLAHHGVLFLDELPEFSRTALEALRQPLEDGHVTISRVAATLSYPARITLVCSMNPCPWLRRGQEAGLPVYARPDGALSGPHLRSFARSHGPLRGRATPYAPGAARGETLRRVPAREGAG